MPVSSVSIVPPKGRAAFAATPGYYHHHRTLLARTLPGHYGDIVGHVWKH
jgi:hypothetical protein